MSYGKMNGFALIKQLYKQKDADGFTKDAELILAKVRCYREGRHGSARWANLSTFTQATDMFRFRVIPDVTVTPDLYIDYQGGRRGPIYYDVASFLWQSSANYSDALRNELIDTYLTSLLQYKSISREEFIRHLRKFVLFRTMQVLGAYGYRGLWEKKQYFIKSIPQAIKNLDWLVRKGVVNEYPYLKEVAEMLVKDQQSRMFNPEVNPKPSLVVKVFSFSFKNGVPQDDSGHGGGYVFDCRGTNNPGRYVEYQHLTGLDQPVIDFLEKDGEILSFLEHIYPIVDFHAKRFIEREFTSLMISFGCTGGQHRSVYCAQCMAQHLHDKFGVKVILCHREQNITQVLE